MTDRSTVVEFFAEHFARQLKQPFDESARVADVDGLDSLAMVDLSIEFEDTFNTNLNLDAFRNAVYVRDVIDEAVRRLTK